MTVATRTDSFLGAPVTQDSLYNAIKIAFANAGFGSPVDEYTDFSHKHAIYKYVYDSTKTYGQVYIRVRVRDDLYVFQSILATWNINTNTGTGECAEHYISQFNTTGPTNFVSLNALPEYGMVVMTQQSNFFYLGIIIPENRPIWWDLDFWPFAFQFVGGNFEVFRSCVLNPYNNQENSTNLTHGYMAHANQVTNRRDLVPGVIFYNQSARGVAGKTSDDLVMVAASGASRFDIVQVPGDSKEYLLLNMSAGALGVRTN